MFYIASNSEFGAWARAVPRRAVSDHSSGLELAVVLRGSADDALPQGMAQAAAREEPEESGRGEEVDEDGQDRVPP